MKEILVKWLGWESYCEWFHSVHTDKNDPTKWYCEECKKSRKKTNDFIQLIPNFLLFNLLLKYFIVGVNLCLVSNQLLTIALLVEQEVKIKQIKIIDNFFIKYIV